MENYDLIAEEFDTDERIERSKIIADEIRLHINDGYNKSAIEYGCGTGLVGFQLINDFNKILFMDSSYGMIEQVKQKLNVLNNPLHFAIYCDFMTDTKQNIKVDYIFLSLVLHHIKNTEEILYHFYNALNSGGHLLVVDVDSDNGNFHAHRLDFDGHNGFEQSILVDKVKKVGFSKIESKTFYFNSRLVNGSELPYSFFILNAEK